MMAAVYDASCVCMHMFSCVYAHFFCVCMHIVFVCVCTLVFVCANGPLVTLKYYGKAAMYVHQHMYV